MQQVVPESFDTTLVKMHQTGKYVPDARWVVERSRGAMHVDRIESAWRFLTTPEIASAEDVDAVYFNYGPITARSFRRPRLFKRSRREAELPSIRFTPFDDELREEEDDWGRVGYEGVISGPQC